MVDMVSDCPCKHDLFQITSYTHHIFNRIFMADMNNILFDDRSCIQLRCNVMACCTDNLYTAFKRTVIGSTARESGQEREIIML